MLIGSTWLACTHLSSPGEKLYNDHCSNCHLSSGKGLARLIPPLASNDHLKLNFASLPCIIKYGIRDTITANNQIYNEPMLGNEILTIIEISNIVNYINTQFAYNKPFLSVEDLNKVLNDCPNK